MKYLSVCSGIEAATVAWHPLGWTPAAFAEIDKFPRAVLAHHYPAVPLHGDFTTIEADQYGAVDILVGGTPCQDFSIAGLRAGIAGERGNLTLQFLLLAARTRPRWLVWENVPGVLSSDGGRALGAFLGGLAELGYGFAYRVFDAQHFGLAQRRARVFVVGHLGDWRRAAAVLFERESLQGHPAPRREAGEGIARPITPGSPGGSGYRNDADTADNLVMAHGQANAEIGSDQCPTLTLLHEAPILAHALRADGFDASEDGTGRGTPLVPVAFSVKDHGADAGPLSPTLRAGGFDKSPANGGVMPAVAFESRFARNGRGAPDVVVPPLKAQSGTNGKGDGAPLVAFDTTQITSKANRSNPQPGDPCHPLAAGAHPPAVAFSSRFKGDDGRGYERPPQAYVDHVGALDTVTRHSVATGMQVRRLTPRECERLQGFPDDYTLIPWRGGMAPDGPRYKALGNSMAVPVMRWIGERIAMVEEMGK